MRAIRRKNIGEALLLSFFLPKGAEIAVTLPPTSPGDKAQYESWKALAAERGLSVRFEAGKDASLAELYESSFLVVTTSVKEGFGYSFLEPLVRGLPVVGREIPHIAGDFRDRGIVFEGLYRGIKVPADAIDGSRLRAAASSRLSRAREAFGPAFSASSGQGRGAERLEALISRLEGRFDGDCLDFGSLDAQAQRLFIERASRDSAVAARLSELNPILDGIFERSPAEDAIRGRRDAALACYSNRAYGELLAAAYEAAASRGSSGAIDKAALAERYLAPDEFFLSAS